MTTLSSPTPAAVVVPDGIEPVEAHRCWSFANGALRSLTGPRGGTVWTPGEPLVATCQATGGQQHRWTFARCGLTREQAEAVHAQINEGVKKRLAFHAAGSRYGLWCPDVPASEPPAGYGFRLDLITHEAPFEACTCGIYAASLPGGVPDTGNVFGLVKLWGKVIPGEHGVRAQYAYPASFRVPPSLADHPALAAFGVPIVADDSLEPQASERERYLASLSNLGLPTPFITPAKLLSGERRRLKMWIAANAAACGANLAMVVMRLWH